MRDLALLRIRRTDTALAAMQRIQHSGAGIALILDDDDKLEATLSDGDLRTAILAGLDLHMPAHALLSALEKIVGRARAKPIAASQRATRAELVALMTTHGIRQVPIVDDGGAVVELALENELLSSAGPAASLTTMSSTAPAVAAVVMAGGRGSRLAPLTDATPKPMLPVGGRPLLERTLEGLRQAGIRDVSLATHYLHDVFEKHFGDGQALDVRLRYLREAQPLGTAGALSLLPPPAGPFLVMNADILTDLDVRALVDFHHDNKAELTVCVRRYEISVPYGVVEAEGADVKRLVEKPSLSFFVNAGIYLLEPTVLPLIPREQRYDMTDLIGALLAEQRRVVSFPVHEYWLDIGRPDDYARANDDVKQGVIG